MVGVTDINDDGTFCGCAKIPLSKNRFATQAFIYTNSRQLLTGATTNDAYPTDMNSSKDLVTRYQVYRDDWGWVSLNDVVVGTSADLARWNQWGYLDLFQGPHLSDRTLIGNGIEAAIVTGGKSGSLVILTPELAK